MRIFSIPFLSCIVALSAACSGDDGDPANDVIKLDDASDEVALTILDLRDRGEIEENDDIAAVLTSPADGAAVPADAPMELTWSLAQSTLRHGRQTGDFVVVDIECSGISPIVVVAIETTSWTMDADDWANVVDSGGPCEVDMVSAYVDRGVPTEGPYVPSVNPSFTVE